ncbi:MAG: hypothetical protein LBP26_04250, partial [Clostridiales bacterium]|nr:hypothetical protein [Clostridiales bacterium]
MAIIAAKCTQCGANIEVDNTKEAGICGHCGTAFITEKVINHYITHNYDNRTVIKNIYGEEKLDADGYIEKAETFLRLNDYDNAE